jgi:hypothetical protein
MYLIAFPLLLIPYVLYHMAALLLDLPLETTLFSVPVLSGTRVAVDVGEALTMVAVILLYVEFLKFSRQTGKGMVEHLLSLTLFGVMAFEFVSVRQAGTGTFLVLIALSFVDLIGGFSLGGRGVRHAVALETANPLPAE